MSILFPEITVLFEDDDVLVINKPAGIVVNRAKTVGELTVQDWIEEHTRYQIPDTRYQLETGTEAELVFKQRSGIAHRLDKETSGALLIAKNPQALTELLRQFKARETEKTYLALVHGKMKTQSGVIDLPIGRNSKMRLQFAVREGGRESQTAYQVRQLFALLDVDKVLQERTEEQQQKYKEHAAHVVQTNFKRASKIYREGFTLVELHPKTGRTHQIRVHLSHLKHPLVGDNVYAGRKRVTLDAVWCPRHFLHASQLIFTHPVTKERIAIEAPLPEDLQHVLSLLVS